jgi:hypothetical protein
MHEVLPDAHTNGIEQKSEETEETETSPRRRERGSDVKLNEKETPWQAVYGQH